MKAKLFVRAIALIAVVTTMLIGSTLFASSPLVSVELCIGLQGTRSAGMGEPISYDLIASDGTVTSETAEAVFTDSNTGCFDTPLVASGTYEIVFKSGPSTTDHLTNSIAAVSFETAGQSITLMEGGNAVLVEGDANSDNQINDSDFSIFVSSYNAVFPLCAGAAGYDARADFNEDECVDDRDFSIFVSNYNAIFPKTGD